MDDTFCYKRKLVTVRECLEFAMYVAKDVIEGPKSLDRTDAKSAMLVVLRKQQGNHFTEWLFPHLKVMLWEQMLQLDL